MEESLEDPQVRAREMVVRAKHPKAGETLQFAPPLKMSDYAFEAARPAPMAGEHSEEILREAGYGDAEIKRLRAAGVI
jgi:formyl-CoA transferase